MPEYTKGNDFSHWNLPDWADWRNKGHIFAYLKVTEGVHFIDPRWITHQANGRAEQFELGPYHYFRVQVNGEVQGQYFFNEAKKREWQLPPMVDVEKRNNLGLATKSVFAARLRNCLVETERAFGIRPIIYTSRSNWHELVGSVAWAGAYDLMVAHYTNATVPLIPDDWKGQGWKIWQFTDKPLDHDRFDGGIIKFREWASLDPSPAPVPNLEERLSKLETEARAHGWAV